MSGRLLSTGDLTGTAGGEEELSYNANQHLCIGAQQDIRTLLHRTAILFDEYGDLRFQHFADIFQDMKFSLIFAGRQSFKEMYELTEDLLDLAKQETFSHNKTPLRGAAFYLMYALYFKQPFRPQARIKVSLSEYKEMVSFVNECRMSKHWEVTYVFYKLVLDDAFHYVAFSRPLGLESIPGIEPRRKAGLPCGDDTTSVQERRNPFKSDRFKKITKRLDLLHAHYASMKVALRDNPEVPDRGLSLISDSLPIELMSQYEPSLTKQLRGDEGSADDDPAGGNQLRDAETGLSIGDRRKKLKYANFDAGANSHREVLRQKMADQLGHSSTTSDDEDPDYDPLNMGEASASTAKGRKKRVKSASSGDDQPTGKKGKGGRPKGSKGTKGLSKSDLSSIRDLKLGAVSQDKSLLKSILPARNDDE